MISIHSGLQIRETGDNISILHQCRMLKAMVLSVLLFAVGAWAQQMQNQIGNLAAEILSKDTSTANHTIAVLPLSIGEGVESDAGKLIAEILIPQVSATGKYKVVDRANFSKIMQELELAESDLVSTDTQIKMGNMLVATRILTGTISQSLGDRLVVLKLIETETGKVISSGSTTLKPAILNSAIKELLGEQGQMSAAIFRSAVAPGWGQFYTGHPIRGSISTLAFVGTLGATLFSSWQSRESLMEWQDLKDQTELGYRQKSCGGLSSDTSCLNSAGREYQSKTKNARSDYEDAFDTAILFGTMTASVYVLNLIDAGIAGAYAKRKFQLYFSLAPMSKQSQMMLAWSF